MSITVQQTIFGFHITLVGNDRARLLESLKLAVPRSNRRFQTDGGYWFIDKRAESRLRRWLAEARSGGGVTVREFDRQKRPVLIEAA